MIRWYMRAQVILSMQTSIDLPVSQRVGAVLDEIRRDLVQPLVSGDDLVVLARAASRAVPLVGVEFRLLDRLGDPVV